MAIHYGLQYQELIRKTVDTVTAARLELAHAEEELRLATKEGVRARNAVTAANKALEEARSILDARLNRGPAEAVEQFRQDFGRYPIQ